MAIQTLNTIKNWFKTTLKPSQQQFWDTWDSFRHKLDKVPVKDVEGIDELLYTKADKNVLNDHITDVNAHASLLELKEDKSQKGIAHGYAPLNSFTKLASQYLDIVNDLVSGGSSSLLSAEQGVILQNQIKNINATLTSDNLDLNTFQEIVDAIESIQSSLSTILVNDLTTGGSMKALTAEMGKILNENKENKSQRGIANGYAPLDNFAKISNTYLNIVNDLITGGTDSLLSAEQGKILKEKIDGIDSLIDNKIDTAEFEYHLSDPNAHSDLLHEKEDKANKNKADGYVGLDGISKISTGFLSMVNDLTTGGDNPLTAEQGKILKGLIDDHTGGDFQATLIAGSEATIDKKFSVRSQNDEIGATSFLTVNSESSEVDGIAGIGMFTNKRLDMAGEHVVLQSFMGYGSLAMRDNGVVLNGNSTSLTLNGGAGGLTLQGGSVATKIATGGLGVTVDGKNILRSINGLEADTSGNIDFSGGGSQNLQQTLNAGGYASFNEGYDELNMFNGGAKAYDVVMNDPVGGNSSQVRIRPDNIDIINNQGSSFGEVKLANGNLTLVRNNGSGVTNVGFNEPSVISTVNFPAPPSAGTYTLATTNDLALVKDSANNRVTWTSNNTPTSSIDIGRVTGSTYRINLQAGTGDNVFINNSGIDLKATSNAGNSSVRVFGAMPSSGNLTYNFTKTTGGTYNIATQDQINMQKVIDNNGRYESSDGNVYFTVQTGIPSDRGVYASAVGNTINGLMLTGNFTQLSSTSTANGSSWFVENTFPGSSTVRLRVVQTSEDSNRTELLFTIPTEDTQVLVPAKPAQFETDGTTPKPYVLATTQDLPTMTTANAAPSSATDTGVKGDIRIDANYIYICIATNTWKRCPLTTW